MFMTSNPSPARLLLGVNIDHVATLRNARGGVFPDPVRAAVLAAEAGADIITFHLREDRRHIRDDDVARLAAVLPVPLNFEAALTDEMLSLIEQMHPAQACFVPERRQEVTTEGGLDVAGQPERVGHACERMAKAGVRVSLFIDPELRQIEAAAVAGAPCVELHTGAYSNAWWARDAAAERRELARLENAMKAARALGLQTNAGHGLALAELPDDDRPSSVAAVAALSDLAELHIGHALIGRAVFVGLAQALADFRVEMERARR